MTMLLVLTLYTILASGLSELSKTFKKLLSGFKQQTRANDDAPVTNAVYNSCIWFT